MNQLSILQHPDFGTIRTEMIDSEPLFCAKDICTALGIENNRQAITKLDDDEKGVITIDTQGGKQQLSAVNESGMYNLIFQSRKAEAKLFRKWVTSEVLPSLRKTGSYHVEPRYGQLAITRGELTIETLNFSAAIMPEIAKIDQGPLRNRLAGLVSYYISKIS